MPSPLRNMPSLAAAATECRISGQGDVKREINPTKDKPCSVRLHGDLVEIYKLREVGGRKTPRLIHQAEPQPFDQVFLLHDPMTFFQSYLACREVIHQMFTQTPLLGEFDLKADSWEEFLPHHLASMIVTRYRLDLDDHMGVGLRYNVDMELTIYARAVYSEPKALLLACKEATAAQSQFMVAKEVTITTECSICMDDLAAEDTVVLPCSHAFHNWCLGPWFHRVSTCPLCRRDMAMYLAAITPKGKFPGLEL